MSASGNPDTPPPAAAPAPSPTRTGRWLWPLGTLLGAGALWAGASFWVSGGFSGSDPALDSLRKTGSLEVASTPPGASLFVNGCLAGKTPLKLSGLRQGDYGLRIEKDGHQPTILHLALTEQPVRLQETLAPCATGRMDLASTPDGAEVLLDGELVGLTPLSLDAVTAGPHELMIRKTNFTPFASRIEVSAGQTLPFQLTLPDKMLAMLQGQVKTEPDRVAHYLDLAHYLYVSDRMTESVEIFLRAQETADKPLEFGLEVSAADRALALRYRNEDRARLKKEIDRLRRGRDKQSQAFRDLLEKSTEAYSQKNQGSWIWVEMAAKDQINRRDFARAEKLYLGFLEAAAGSNAKNGDANQVACRMELLKLRLTMRNLRGAKETFTQLFAQAEHQADLLLDMGQTLVGFRDRVLPTDRVEVLEMADKSFRRGLVAAPSEAVKAECAYELGNVLLAQKHPAESVAYFEQSVASAPPGNAKEDRALQWAEALRQAGRLPEAREKLEPLLQSARADVRERARARLTLLLAAEPRKEPSK